MNRTLDRLIDGRLDYVVDCIDAYRTKAALIAHCRRRKIPIVTVGGAGGQVDPLKVSLADLSRSEQDPLLSKTRKLLRQEYGFSRNLKRRFLCLRSFFSVEHQKAARGEREVCDPEGGKPGITGLNCTGFGSSSRSPQHSDWSPPPTCAEQNCSVSQGAELWSGLARLYCC